MRAWLVEVKTTKSDEREKERESKVIVTKECNTTIILLTINQ